jgi:hypothetical protein
MPCKRINKYQGHIKGVPSTYGCDVEMRLPSVYGAGTDAGLSDLNSRVNSDFNRSTYYNSMYVNRENYINNAYLRNDSLCFHTTMKSCMPPRRRIFNCEQ